MCADEGRAWALLEVDTRAAVGMSSDKRGENPLRRKPKGS